MSIKPANNLAIQDPANEEFLEDDLNHNDNSELSRVPYGSLYDQSLINAHARTISRTINYDIRLISKAIESISAQCKMYAKRGIMPDENYEKILSALSVVQRNISNGEFDPSESTSVYDFLESKINEHCKDSTQWFRFILSKPSQLSGDISLLVRDNIESIDRSLSGLISILIDRSEENVKTLFPSYVNNQLTQPTSFALHLMAYVETFNRDRRRLKNCRENINVSPFCSNEGSGTLLNINRESVSRNLGFSNVNRNSLNSVSSYDSIVEFCSTLSIISTTVSRLSKDLNTWNSSYSNFINFNNVSEHHTVLPFHKTTKSLDHIVSECSKSNSQVIALFNLLNSQPYSYSDSYQSIVECISNSYDSTYKCIQALTSIIADFTINRKNMKEAASKDYSTSVDLMHWFVKNLSMSPNEAEELTRKIVEHAVKKNKKLSLLELSELQTLHKDINDDIYSVLIPSRAMISRRSGNGSNPVQIRKSIRIAKREYI